MESIISTPQQSSLTRNQRFSLLKADLRSLANYLVSTLERYADITLGMEETYIWGESLGRPRDEFQSFMTKMRELWWSINEEHKTSRLRMENWRRNDDAIKIYLANSENVERIEQWLR